MTLTNCTVSGNSATVGGGLYGNKGTATLTNVTLSGKHGRHQRWRPVQCYNTVHSDQRHPQRKPGRHSKVLAGLWTKGTATLGNTIVAGNNSDIAGLVTGSFNLIGTGVRGRSGQRNQRQPRRRGRSKASPRWAISPAAQRKPFPCCPAAPPSTRAATRLIPRRRHHRPARRFGLLVNSTVDIGAFESSRVHFCRHFGKRSVHQRLHHLLRPAGRDGHCQ